ncbi:Major facilitator superfamily domain general substrate transporter [Penicillium cf. griseofulvum]|uniref:Major facilitator superfamily domain general substrate transporter n=1 Tax=Penicillium cf. griseofulvum TaxID=2972120 RepID=A0A9W9MRS4_9EURO|nr:Major facilitator superfamily domain general substrate transporter [Penicillium cf. griseofulvum]KAJ5440715.1 Major facilitator superfamily domain general substrate transporter [Penicillium cf. griseofulvum]KAJ5448763.1 Major facilitator superfamily domain general substrate transporter [Penicillium cf. griseofulvum]
MDQTGRSMAVVVGTQMIADCISPIAGAYIAQSPELAMVDLAGSHRTRILQLSVTGCAPGDIHSRHSKVEGRAERLQEERATSWSTFTNTD